MLESSSVWSEENLFKRSSSETAVYYKKTRTNLSKFKSLHSARTFRELVGSRNDGELFGGTQTWMGRVVGTLFYRVCRFLVDTLAVYGILH